ncbi:hypothetical protein ACJX0J_005961, partial [Zea mays]
LAKLHLLNETHDVLAKTIVWLKLENPHMKSLCETEKILVPNIWDIIYLIQEVAFMDGKKSPLLYLQMVKLQFSTRGAIIQHTTFTYIYFVEISTKIINYTNIYNKK